MEREEAGEAAGTRWWCAICQEPVLPEAPESPGSAVHEATGGEKGPDGHFAAPVSRDPKALAMQWWCRTCDEPVTVTGCWMSRQAVHASSGEEKGEDGHLAVAIGSSPQQRDRAREIEARFPRWVITLPFEGLCFRADWRDQRPGVIYQHYEDRDPDALEEQLAYVERRMAAAR